MSSGDKGSSGNVSYYYYYYYYYKNEDLGRQGGMAAQLEERGAQGRKT